MRRAHGMALARPGTRPPKSSTSSAKRSTRLSLTPRSRHGSPIWAAPCLAARPPISEGSSPTKPRNGQGDPGSQHQTGVTLALADVPYVPFGESDLAHVAYGSRAAVLMDAADSRSAPVNG